MQRKWDDQGKSSSKMELTQEKMPSEDGIFQGVVKATFVV
jgi:hypothetical protein